MGWTNAQFTGTLVIPTGATSGARVVVDGDTGAILIYDADGVVIAEVSPDVDPDGQNPGGFWTRGFQTPDPIYSFLGGGLVVMGPIPSSVCDEHGYLIYQTDSTFSPQYAALTMSSGVPDDTYNPARVQLVAQNGQVPQAYVDGGSIADRADLNVTGMLRTNGHVMGTTTISPVANTPTSATVSYGFAMPGSTFRGYATANTTGIGSSVRGVAVTGVTSTQMQLWVYRTNTNNTNIFWEVWADD